MKRRGFLKTLASGVGYLMLPHISFADTPKLSISTCAELTAAMEKMFVCKMGDAAAFIEFDKAQAAEFFTPAAYETVKDNEITRLTYQSFGYAGEGGSAEEAEKKLATYFHEQFKAMDEQDKKMLIWRVKPQFSSEVINKFGDVWMTAEQLEDNPPLQIPEGVEFDFATGTMRHVVEKTNFHRLRMRMAMPEVTFDEALVKPEGGITPRLEDAT